MMEKKIVDEELRNYRKHLVSAVQKAHEDYDKTIIALSGGALGISFAFIKDILGGEEPVSSSILFTAWVCWGVSVVSVLASYFFSILALRRAIKQVDTGQIYETQPGGSFTRITNALNATGGVLFFVGVVLIIIFVSKNM